MTCITEKENSAGISIDAERVFMMFRTQLQLKESSSKQNRQLFLALIKGTVKTLQLTSHPW